MIEMNPQATEDNDDGCDACGAITASVDCICVDPQSELGQLLAERESAEDR